MTKIQIGGEKFTGETKPGNVTVSVDSQRKRSVQCMTCASLFILTLAFLITAASMTMIILHFQHIRHVDNTNASRGAELGLLNDDASSVGPQAKTKFTFDDAFGTEFVAKRPSFSWYRKDANKSEMIMRENGDLVVKDYRTNASRTLMDGSIFTNLSTASYFVSPDEKYILLPYKIKRIWRHSYTAKYKAYDIEKKKLINIPSSGETLQYCRWSASGNSLVFVLQNNMYFMETPETSTPTQLTTTGKDKVIFNGIPDWVYEEDVIVSNAAHYWSPTSSILVYATFNDTQVPMHRFPWYGRPSDVYEEIVEIAYAKPADVRGTMAGPNTVAELYFIEPGQSPLKSTKIPPPDEFKDVDHYYHRVTFLEERRVLVTWANRVQNVSITERCELEDPVKCKKIYKWQETEGWTKVPAPRQWILSDKQSYLTLLPQNITGLGNWQHIARIYLDTSKPKEYLTKGAHLGEVTSILALDEANKFVYYTATNGDPRQRHIRRVKLDNSSHDECLSCGLNDGCEYFGASFSASMRWYLESCEGRDTVPKYTMKSTVEGQDPEILEDNKELKQKIGTKILAKAEYYDDIPLGGNEKGHGVVYKPPDSKASYPLLTYTYAGPTSQAVTYRNAFSGRISRWHQYLASTHGIIVASLDGRGTAARGDDFKFKIYRKCGDVEIEDQIGLVKHLMGKNELKVDKTKTAIWGWSYGGFASSHALGAESNKKDGYQCAMAVAPVSNQALYDTAYSERYLGLATPDDNAYGYNVTNVLNKIHNFKDKKYFLAHGSADDNVHFFNAARLIQALTEAEIQFDFQMYIDKDHGISGTHTSPHLFTALGNFLLYRCYEYDDKPAPSPTSTPASGNYVTYSYLLSVALVLKVVIV